MNFLAHIYLSGDSRELLIGNFIGDYVKGKDYEKYPPAIQDGILLHRKIDWFTDDHSITKKAKKLVRGQYGLYAGIVIDIFYDHYLSANWDQYILICRCGSMSGTVTGCSIQGFPCSRSE